MNRRNPERKPAKGEARPNGRPDAVRDTLHTMMFGSWSRWAWTLIAILMWMVTAEFLYFGLTSAEITLMDALSVVVPFGFMAILTTSMVVDMWWAKLTKKKQGPPMTVPSSVERVVFS